MTSREFIEKITQKALWLYEQYHILPSLTISQACLESGFGKHAPGNNLFGFKWTENCGYDYQLLWTYEYIDGQYKKVQAKFRKYNSFEDSIDDYGKLIGTKKRYKPVIECADYKCACKQIKACGYATGKDYDKSLIKIIENYKLYKYDNNMQLNNNFNIKEFYCEGQRPPDEYIDNIKRLANELQKLRDYYNKPIIVTSGWRCKKHNDTLPNASKKSFHLRGLAADIKIIGVKPKDIYLVAINHTEFKGFGIGVNWIHLDLRNVFTTWEY